MSDENRQECNESEFEVQFKLLAKSLWDKVEAGNYAEAANIMQTINETREQSLYQEIGLLTRSLHEAIKDIKVDQGAGNQADQSDATDKLTYIVDMTAKAANTTMDKVEEGMPLAQDIRESSKDLSQRWQQFMNKELKPSEFRVLSNDIQIYLNRTEKSSTSLHDKLSEILLAQDYQDLTGQVIQRVIKTIKDVEERLINLVSMAGQIDAMTGMSCEQTVTSEIIEEPSIVAEGPIINAKKRDDVVSGQDDVDDLLSSLGF
jgi:chemotaxis protein CheZ